MLARTILMCLALQLVVVLAGVETAAVGSEGPAAAEPRARPGRRPNILFCISDDQSCHDAGAYGSKMVRTPAFDHIAREGILFTNVFTSNPTCAPSRASVLTGQAFYRLEEGASNWGTLDRKFPVFPDMLEKAGYAIGYTGKGWGPGDWAAGGRNRDPAGPAFHKRRCKPPTTGISACDYAGNFADFLKTRKPAQPFYFWYGGLEPHRPYEVGSGLKAGKKLAEAEVPPFLLDAPPVRLDLLDYALEIEWFDTHLARMIKMLEEARELDNTIVIVTSDNGMPFARAKGRSYDAGTHEPFAVRWGSHIKRGRVVTDFVSFTDIAPTLLKAAGLEPLPKMTGKSFLDVLLSGKSGRVDASRDHVIAGRERFYPTLLPYPFRVLRTDQYLYIRNFKPERNPEDLPPGFDPAEAGPSVQYMFSRRHGNAHEQCINKLCLGKLPAEELYNLKNDRWEMRNVANEERLAADKKALAARLEAELKRTGDPRILGGGDVFDSYPTRVFHERTLSGLTEVP
jgi:uncharacterized sulfatase